MDTKEDIIKLWHENVDSILAQQSPKRRQHEQERIQVIRELMSDSALGKDLLDWADDNDIVILMDKEIMVGGYHLSGLKTIALSTHIPNGQLINTLAHEIRHAWQDGQGFLPLFNNNLDKNSVQTATEYMLQVRFLEADATAIGNKVLKDVIEKRGKLAMLKHLPMTSIISHTIEFKTSLVEKFNDFFYDDARKNAYDERSLKIYAAYMGISNIIIPYSELEYDDEKFSDQHNMPFNIGINVHDEASIRKLGEIFNQGNYMDNLPEGFHKAPFYSAGFSLENETFEVLKKANTLRNSYKPRKL